jgi:hypothetical protein
VKKIFLALIIAIPSLCWGWVSTANEKKYEEIWKLFKASDVEKAIIISSEVIDNDNTPNLDKLHFLVSRSIFTSDLIKRQKDLTRIDELVKNDFECFREYDIYYR